MSINQKKIVIVKRLIELNKQLDKLTRYYQEKKYDNTTILKDTLEEINPKLALGSNSPTINFLDLTIGEFEKLKTILFIKNIM